MFEEKSQYVTKLVYSIDIFLTIVVFICSFWLRLKLIPLLPADELDFYSHIAVLPLILAFFITFLPYFDAYRGPRAASIFSYSWAIMRAVGLSTGLLMALLFLLKIQYISRVVVVVFAVSITVAMVFVRMVVQWKLRRSINRGEKSLRILVVGTGSRAERLSTVLRQRSEWGIEIVGHLDPCPAEAGSTVLGHPILGKIDAISGVLRDQVIDEVIVAIPRTMISDVEQIAHACEEEGVRLRFMADMFDLRVARMRLVRLGDIPLLTLEPVAQDETKLLVKRLIDLTVSLLSMPVVLPLMAVFAIAIKLDSPGPVFFVQQRVGFRKRVFPMLKFRSMHVGSDEKLKELEHMNEAEGPIFKIANDPRVTRVGRFLRRTSFDEFPQLLNVIKGDMSLVGPRPMSLRDVNLFDKGIQRKRFSVKPGLTCLWQVSGRSNLPFTKWLELDLNYIENWSLSLDLKILIKTFPAVLRGSGAV